MPKTRTDPVRTCVACRLTAGKGELVRLVRDPDTMEIRIDPTGRAPGRGAYVHRSPECVELALRRGGLARALKAAVPEEVWAALAELAAPA
ncbi:MAG TPA: YlxR family protein [Candidatus Dormibacteraeota bacterium]